jgi:hypothetical protein
LWFQALIPSQFCVHSSSRETVAKAQNANFLTTLPLKEKLRREVSMLICEMMVNISAIYGLSFIYHCQHFRRDNGGLGRREAERGGAEKTRSCRRSETQPNGYCMPIISNIIYPKNMFRQICKFFLEAVEINKYGWFWECPNGKSCIYRHALPPGFQLKKVKYFLKF